MYQKLTKRCLIYCASFVLIVYCVISFFHREIIDFSESQSKPKSPPVVVYLRGGLGNQLFQYALAYSLARNRTSALYICVFQSDYLLRYLNLSPFSSKMRLYALDRLSIPQDNLIIRYRNLRHPECRLDYYLDNNKVENFEIDESDVMNGNLPLHKVIIAKGWFESEIFFMNYKEDIIRLYNMDIDTRSIDKVLDEIKNTESVSVHIRRGDFIEDSRTISISYQKKAMKAFQTMLNNTEICFYIFTDDVIYAKSHFLTNEFKNLKFISDLHGQDNSLLDFLLMLTCKHNIIVNSTFSWWAAYLNKNKHKIVIAPMPKYSSAWISSRYSHDKVQKKLISEFAYPKDWMTMTPEFELSRSV